MIRFFERGSGRAKRTAIITLHFLYGSRTDFSVLIFLQPGAAVRFTGLSVFLRFSRNFHLAHTKAVAFTGNLCYTKGNNAPGRMYPQKGKNRGRVCLPKLPCLCPGIQKKRKERTMKLKQTIAALVGAVMLAAIPISTCTFTAFAETDDFYNGSEDSDQVETFTSGDYTYSLLSSTENAGRQAACLESCTSKEENLVIPETIDGYEVVALGDNTFMDNTTAKTITIPKTVIGTGLYTFFGCTGVTEYIVDPENEYYEAMDGILYAEDQTYLVQYPIGKNPTEFTVPDKVYDIGNSAFAECKSLKTVTIPDSVKQIGVWAFAGCSSLTSVTLPKTMTKIEDFCFAYDEAITEFNIPDTIQTICAGAFAGCKGMKTFKIPSACTTIEQAAFAGTSLDSITVPETVTSIGFSALGYDLDENNQFVARPNFTIYSTAGSAAARYSIDDENDNHFTFVQITKEQTTGDATTRPNIEGVPVNGNTISQEDARIFTVIKAVILALIAIAIVALTAVGVVISRRKRALSDASLPGAEPAEEAPETDRKEDA